MTKTNSYRFGAGLAIGTVLFLIWLSLAVGINGPDGEPFDRIYLGVLFVGIIGALVARFRARGMSWVLMAMAVAQVVVVVIALATGKHLSGVSPALEIIGVNGIFAVLFLGSAWLFRRAV